jgi:hypothetical protein
MGDLIDWTSGFWVMFKAVDDSPWSIVEAGLDAFSLARLDCDPSGVGEDAAIASKVALGASRPNPFSATTTIRFEIPREAPADLTVYSVSGRAVRTLVSSGVLAAGEHVVSWDGRDENGRPVASGTYFYRLRVDEELAATRVVVLR